MKIIKFTLSTSPSVIVENAPLNFVRAGEYQSNGNIINNSKGGYYWSTTCYDEYDANLLGFDSNNFISHYAFIKGYGFSVHWVTRTSPILQPAQV